jgi:TP901-1 family phage major tail protein
MEIFIMPAGQGTVGRKVILKISGAPVAGVREKSVAINGEAIDVSADDSSGWRELLADPSEQQVDISVSGVAKANVLKVAAFASGARIKALTLEYPDGGIIIGDFYLATYSETNPYKDAVTFEASLQSSGPVTYTPGP